MKLLKKTVLFTLGLGAADFTYSELYKLIPFEEVSIRGAVMALREENFVSVYQRQSQTRIQLTTVGSEALKGHFPALKPTSGRKERTWTVCIFTGHGGIQTLRAELMAFGFFPLSRGVYVLPSAMAPQLSDRLSAGGLLHKVLIFETQHMVIGDEKSIIRLLFDIKTISRQGELIEKTLNSLDRKLIEKTKPHPKTIESYVNLIPQLMGFLAEDLNVPELYFPQEVRLSAIKQLLTRVSAQILPKI